MDTSDNREGAHVRQARNATPPAVQPGGLYRTSEVKANFGISDATWDHWTYELGLQVCEGTGARDQLIFGDDILDFMRQFRGKRITKKRIE